MPAVELAVDGIKHQSAGLRRQQTGEQPAKPRSVAKKAADERKNHYEPLNVIDDPQQQVAAAHYDTNLVLYATDFEPNTSRTHNRHAASRHAGADSTGKHIYVVQQPIGKFVDSYPSWRQSQCGSGANYSFHVPLHLQQQQQPMAPSQQQQVHYYNQNNRQSRYGYVAAANPDREVRPSSLGPTKSGGFKPEFRSKTIPNLPSLVKVSVDQTLRVNGAPSADHQSTYEDFYDRSDEQCIGAMSEGDLLKAHIVDIKTYGHDNPFKPGTELSWEADMMVKLIQRGYPVSELPNLIEAAKQVAREEHYVTSKENMVLPVSNSNKLRKPVRMNQAHESQDGRIISKTQSKMELGVGSLERGGMGQRQLSTDHLSPSKKVWANTMRQSKSLPRFTTTCNPNSCNFAKNDQKQRDSDSIDRLITSIEAEMNDLLGMELGNKQQQQQQQVAAEKSHSGHVAILSTASGKLTGESPAKVAPRRKSSDTRETNVKKRIGNQVEPKRKIHQQQKHITKSQTSSDLTEYQKKRRKTRKCCLIQ